MPVLITRCTNNYGPYQFPEKLIPLMYLKAIAGEPLPVYGDGMQVRDWIYVDDHCLGVEATLLKGEAGRIYNFGGDAEKPNIEVVKKILELTGRDESLIRYVADRPGHDRRYAIDFSRAERELDWRPTVTFEEGLAMTIDWYRTHPDWLERVQSGAYRDFMDEWYGDRQ
jgi:dTDP-glucose 4,6-dehydratase